MIVVPDVLITGFALGLVLLVVSLTTNLGRRARAGLSAAWVVVVLVLDVSGLEDSRIAAATPSPGSPYTERMDGFVTSDACQACHPNQHASWDESYHRKMTQLPSDESVLAPFGGELLSYQYKYIPHRRGDDFWVTTTDPTWAEPGEELPVSRRIALTTGSHHQQLYWFERPGTRAVGRFQFFYRVREERWVPFNAALLVGERNLPEPGIYWSTVCVRCHATHGKPGFELPDPGAAPMDTRVAEFGIACESCHGPGEEHVRANRSLFRRYRGYFSSEPDDTIVNPSRLDADRSLDVCGQCHAVQGLGSTARIRQWSRNGLPYRAGDDLSEARYIVDGRPGKSDNVFHDRVLRQDPHFIEDRFWPDGVVNVSGREYQGVRDSPCYASGEYTCLSCHQLHRATDDPRSTPEWANDQLASDRLGNDACVECHPALAEPAALEEHSHHAANSTGSSCYNCHMPNTAYGLLNATRSHFIENPDTATELATGRPNACNLCHLDQTLAWTADKLEAWYGTPVPVFEDPAHSTTAQGVLVALRGDAGQRALMAFHLGWEPARLASGADDWALPVLGELFLDPYDAVRAIAARALQQRPDARDMNFDYLETPPSRRALRNRLIEAWSGPEAGDPELRARVLIDGAGQTMAKEFAVLLDERDNGRAFRAE